MIDWAPYPELLVKCISGPKVIEDVLRLSAVSKVFYELINSSGFFLALAGFKSSQKCFKDHYIEWRKHFVIKAESLPGILYGDAWVSHKGVELFPFDKWSQVARSDRYLALYDGTSNISVFTPDRETLLMSYEFTGNILQLSMDESKLYVVESGAYSRRLVGFDLESLSKEPFLERSLSFYVPVPVYFGKNDIIYVINSFGSAYVYAINLASTFTFEAVGEVTQGLLQYFPNGERFIELSRNGAVINLSDVIIEEELFKRKEIACDIAENIPMNVKIWFTNACFSKDRLFIAYNVPDVGLKIYAYDLQIKEMYEVLSLPIMEENPDFRSRFLCVDETIYYLRMEI